MLKTLDSAIPDWQDGGGWTYNSFFASPYLRLEENVIVERLIEKTIAALSAFGCSNRNIFLYHDGMAGWRSTPRKIKGYKIECADDVKTLIPSDIYFRDAEGRSDNYNFIDESGSWMITFCHEDDWFIFHRSIEALNAIKDEIQA